MKYLVLTPKFDYTEWINEYGGPTYPVRDFVEIVAKNKKDAVALGVKYMLTHRYSKEQGYKYVHDRRSDGLSPYVGVRAYSLSDLRKRYLKRD